MQLELNRQLDILSNLSNRYTQSSNHLIRLIHENMSMHDDDVKGLQLQLQKQLELGQMLELNPTTLGESVLVDPDSATRLAEEELQSANIISQMDYFLELLNQMELKQAQRRRLKKEEQKQEEEEQELG